MNNRLVIISNRLPVTVFKHSGKIKVKESSGGLVTALTSYLDYTKTDYIWIGWPGDSFKPSEHNNIRKKLLSDYKCFPVFLSDEEVNDFYYGFCNKTLWPLFHYFPLLTTYNEKQWQNYTDINKKFCDSILNVIKPDDIIWVHDYHLMLLPNMIRDNMPDARIGFFLHIPFPSFEIFRLLPRKWGREILDGLLGADLVGFHIHDYTYHFLRCILRILGYDNNLGNILLEDRILKADTFPIGIDFNKFYDAANSEKVKEEKEKLSQTIAGYKVIFSADRLDYTKGVINRLEGFETFLEKNKEWHDKVIFHLLIVPSRTKVDQYQKMKRQIDESIGRINGKFGNIHWTPIHYEYKFVPFETLIAYYSNSDAGLITPLRDGMNLVAKEYIASNPDKKGVLILSEMAGAASELGEAIIINPYHKEEIAESIKEALEMPLDEQLRRNKIMQERLKRYNVITWSTDFINELIDINKNQKSFIAKILDVKLKNKLFEAYKAAQNRVIFLDYDGTLIGFSKNPQAVIPGPELIDILHNLAKEEKNTVVIATGRDKDTLDNWLGNLNLNFIAEHGCRIKYNHTNEWQKIKPLNTEWMLKIIPVLTTFCDRLPGSFIEQKEFSVVWHYRKCDPDLSSIRVKEATDYLINITANLDLQVLQGSKIVEIRNAGINKGIGARYWLQDKQYDFIMAVGDDFTDEDLFKVLPDNNNTYSIKVGLQASYAKYNLKNYKEILDLLKKMTML